jgi:transcriptional regulator with XRE-family HTH domain
MTTASTILRERYFEGDPDRQASLEQARLDGDIAQALYDLRTAAGLTQAQLAERVGTSASNISRLEDADYQGHSMAMLRRIARALGKRVVIGFIDVDEPTEEQEETEESIDTMPVPAGHEAAPQQEGYAVVDGHHMAAATGSSGTRTTATGLRDLDVTEAPEQGIRDAQAQAKAANREVVVEVYFPPR